MGESLGIICQGLYKNEKRSMSGSYNIHPVTPKLSTEATESHYERSSFLVSERVEQMLGKG